MKKTKLFGIFSLVLSAGMLLSGCNDSFTGKTAGKTAYIKIGQVNASRSALPDFTTETIANFNFTLTGTKEGDTEKELGSFTSLADLQAESIAITTGIYNFTLRAEKSGSVLEDTITNQEITTGDNSLAFNLKWDETSLDPTCLGNLEITIDFSTAVNANLLKVIRIDLLSYDPETEETTQIVDNDSNPISDYQKEFFPVDFSDNKALYTLNGLPSGVYLMQAYCYADVYGEVPLLESPLDDIVVITGSQTSKDTIAVASLADVYTISFENLNNTYLSNKNYTQHSPDITLQTLSKSGWFFNGWYDNPSFTGEAITSIEKGSCGNKVLYAKWSRANGISVNIESTNDLSLTASVDELHKAVRFTAKGAKDDSTYTWFVDGIVDDYIQENTYLFVPSVSGLKTYVIEVISGHLSATATVSISTESDIYVSATANTNVTADGTEDKPFASIEDACAAITSFDYYVDPVIDFTINISGTLTSAQTIPGNMKNYAKSLTLTGRSALVNGVPQDGIDLTVSGSQSPENALTIVPDSNITSTDFAVITKNLSISGAYYGICVGTANTSEEGAANVILDSGTLIDGNQNGVHVFNYTTARVKDGVTISNNHGTNTMAGIYVERLGKLYLEGGSFSGNSFSPESVPNDIYCNSLTPSDRTIYISGILPEVEDSSPFATIIITGLDSNDVYDGYQLINNDGLSESQFAAQCAKFHVESASNSIKIAIKVNEEGKLQEDLLTTIYVSSTKGSSEGLGTASSPFATISEAESYIAYNNPNPEADYTIKLEGTFSDGDSYHTIYETLNGKARSIIYMGISEADSDGNPTDEITGLVDGDGTRERYALCVQTSVPIILKNIKITGGQTGIYIDDEVIEEEADITIGQGCLITDNGNDSGLSITNGKVTLDGGTITNNAGDNGAGVNVSGGEFIMKSGSINNNSSQSLGGGVYIGYIGSEYGTFTMLGGTISGNNSSVGYSNAVSVEQGATFNIGGSALIDSNNDIYLADGAKITIVDALTGTSPIATITPETYSTDNVILTLGKDSNGNNITTTSIAKEFNKFKITEQEGGTPWYMSFDGTISHSVSVPGISLNYIPFLTPMSVVLVSRNEGTIPNLLVSDHEVTQGEYEEYCKYGGSSRPDSNYGVDENFPAYYVNWYDAIVYCNLRSKAENLNPVYKIGDETDPTKWPDIGGNATDKWCGPSGNNDVWNEITFDETANGYRLPTNAEWEYLARGGNLNSQYTYSGSDNIDIVAWYYGFSGDKTHEVKSRAANRLGLYDMSGNVWELCYDWQGDISRLTPATGPASGNYRVKRGGSFATTSEYCSVSYIGYGNPYDREPSLGFRVVRTITE
ncbi:MAG: SUMF1/EgtB/PvdO family nonheme iron enzyme [Treponema sp.]|nr:SUMF1/EgtB/PvdO family nonheme iron enzyme [Treponema sp.]